MALTSGLRLGPSDIQTPIGTGGTGGTGEVYRARDTKFGGDVSLKLLPDLFANDRERLVRFDRAKALDRVAGADATDSPTHYASVLQCGRRSG